MWRTSELCVYVYPIDEEDIELFIFIKGVGGSLP